MESDQVKHWVKKWYDQKARKMINYYESSPEKYFVWRRINTALYLGSFEKRSHILEIGCATGRTIFCLAKLGYSMTGVDISTECIKLATEKAQKIGINNSRFVVCDAENLSMFSENMFDGVISFSTLRYLPNLQKALYEIFRVVKRHHNVVVDFPNRRSPWYNYIKPVIHRMHGTNIHDHIDVYDHQYTTKQIKYFFQRAGLQKIQMKRILYTSRSINQGLLKVMKWVDVIGESSLFNNFAALIVCKGEKP